MHRALRNKINIQKKKQQLQAYLKNYQFSIITPSKDPIQY